MLWAIQGLLLSGWFGGDEPSACSPAGTPFLPVCDEVTSPSARHGGAHSSLPPGRVRWDRGGDIACQGVTLLRVSPCPLMLWWGSVLPGWVLWGTGAANPPVLSGSRLLFAVTNYEWKGQTRRGASGRR